MRKRILYHVLFWILYVIFKSYLNYEAEAFLEKQKSNLEFFIQNILIQVVFLVIKIPLVYTLFYITNKYLDKVWNLYKTILFVTILFIIGSFCFALSSKYLVMSLVFKQPIQFKLAVSLGSFLYSFFVLCFTSGIAMAIKLIRVNIRQKEAEKELLKKKLETELNLLKSQVNPHFLFNTLNNIYGLAIKKSEHTAQVVMKLSKLLRFMLYESSNDRILLSQEIKLLADYIDLEKIRYNDRLTLNIDIQSSTTNAKITPLLLLPLVENAFKHGASESMCNSSISIKLTETNNLLTLIIENSKEHEDSSEIKENIGLKNLRRQLELTYSDFKLEINKQQNSFIVFLYINLNSYGKV